MKKYRIFLGYREGTLGEELMRDMYFHIVNTYNYVEKYGEPYFSPVTEPVGNFWDYNSMMKNIEYFIIPYTKGFFDTKEGGKPIIVEEINAALENGCTKFIAVFCEGFEEEDKIASYYEKALVDRTESEIKCVTGAKHNFVYKQDNSEQLVNEICTHLLFKKNILEIYNENTPNVYLAKKVK